MRYRFLLAVLAATSAVTLVAAQVVYARADAGSSVVFVQTNETSGNHVVSYNVGSDGQLARADTYATGGNGGTALPGNESYQLASQGSLVYDASHRLLIAVNAGSDSVSTFSVDGNRLELTDVVASGGEFPASIAVHGNLVSVLTSGGVGIVQGFRIAGAKLQPTPHSVRSLGLANTDPPFFLTSPGQVGFTPDGRQLIVTTKASGSLIDVFQVEPDGTLSAAPVANPSATPVPFAFTFAHGRLVMGEAGASSLTTYAVRPDGTLTDSKSQSNGQAALCWILRVGPFLFVSNTGTSNISSFRLGPGGQPVLLSAVAATSRPARSAPSTSSESRATARSPRSAPRRTCPRASRASPPHR